MRAIELRTEPRLRHFFFNREQRLRNGWWMLLFIGVVFVTRFVHFPADARTEGPGSRQALA